MAWYAVVYSVVLTFLGWRYPNYRHHKNLNAFAQLGRVLWSFFRYVRYAVTERPVLSALQERWRKRYFLVPLQVHDDYQVKRSRFRAVPAFIREVVSSFARHAGPSDLLVLKHHPLDRGSSDYTQLLRDLSAQHGLEGRLVYVHDLHLPTLLRHARATIVLNSTVGFSSLLHGTPVKVLDDAVYDIKGLTVELELDELWTAKRSVDRAAFARVRNELLHQNQANGSFYRRLPDSGPAGVIWPSMLLIPAIAAPRATEPSAASPDLAAPAPSSSPARKSVPAASP
jgi:capsule polysaccharide modification protein KpsS